MDRNSVLFVGLGGREPVRIHRLIIPSPSDTTGTHSTVVKDSIPAHPGACGKWNTSTKQAKARGVTLLSVCWTEPGAVWSMNMHRVYGLALSGTAQRMVGMLGAATRST